MFSKACEYGIKATIYIAQQSQRNERVHVKEIAEAIDSPVAFTAKTLQILAKHSIIRSVMGFSGGYEIDCDKLHEITLFHIVEAIDGDPVYNGCGLGLHKCNDAKPCPIHHDFKKIRNDLKEMLQCTYVISLTEKLDNKLAFLKINFN